MRGLVILGLLATAPVSVHAQCAGSSLCLAASALQGMPEWEDGTAWTRGAAPCAGETAQLSGSSGSRVTVTVTGSASGSGGFSLANGINFGAGATLQFSPGNDGAYLFFDDGEGCGGGGTTSPTLPNQTFAPTAGPTLRPSIATAPTATQSPTAGMTGGGRTTLAPVGASVSAPTLMTAAPPGNPGPTGPGGSQDTDAGRSGGNDDDDGGGIATAAALIGVSLIAAGACFALVVQRRRAHARALDRTLTVHHEKPRTEMYENPIYSHLHSSGHESEL